MTQNRCYCIVLGGPGSGKGTQCETIVEKFPDWRHISMGELLRSEVRKGTAMGMLCEEFLDEGTVVPVDVVTELLHDEIEKVEEQKILVDGFPRTLEQVTAFEEQIGPIVSVIFYDASDSVLRERLQERREKNGRKDDNDKSIERRLRTFREKTIPVKDQFESQSKLTVISATASVGEIFDQTAEQIRQIEGTWKPPKPLSLCCIC